MVAAARNRRAVIATWTMLDLIRVMSHCSLIKPCSVYIHLPSAEHAKANSMTMIDVELCGIKPP